MKAIELIRQHHHQAFFLTNNNEYLLMLFDDQFGQFGKQMNDFTEEQDLLANILKSAGKILTYTKELDMQFEALNV